jgi:ABC-2 type transport system permease protein
MRVALVIAGKELRQRLRDRSALILAFVAPTVLAAIVTGAFGSGFGPDNTDFHLLTAVSDQDRSRVSTAFTGLLGSKALGGLIVPKAVRSPGEVRRMVRDEKAAAGYIIPKGFQDRVSRGLEAKLIVVGRADDPIFRDIAAAVATGFTEQVNASRLSVFTTVRAEPDTANLQALGAQAARGRIPVQLRDVGVAARKVSGANYFGPGMAMFFLFFTVSAGARSIYAERDQGTLPRILAAPARKSSLLLGKAGATFVLGLVSMAVMFGTMRFLFGVHWGDPLAIALLTVLVVIALMAVTAVVQTLAKTEAQAGNYGGIVGMVLTLAGGNFFPLFLMPAFIQRLSALTPNGWALRGFTDIAYDGATAADLVPNFLAIAAFAVVFGTIAAFRAQRIAVR